MDDVDAAVDQPVREPHLLARHVVSPIAAPMDGDDGHVPVPLRSPYLLLDLGGRLVGEIEEEGDAGEVIGCGPARRDAARFGSEGMDDDPEAGPDVDGGGAAHAQSRSMERLQRLDEPGVAVVEHMVVGEAADVDGSGAQAADIRWVHAIVDALRPGVFAASHAGFEIHDARVGRHALQLSQGISPDVRELDRARNGTIHLLGELDVRPGILDEPLVDQRIARVRQDLVDASPGHDVAAEEDGDESLSAHVHDPFKLRRPRAGRLRPRR